MMAIWVQFLLIAMTFMGGMIYTLQPDFLPSGKQTTLRVGVLRDGEPEALKARYAPLLDYLSEYLQLPTTLVLPENYQALLSLFDEGGVDLVYFGGAPFVSARRIHEAKPLVMRDIDLHYTSSFIVKTSSRFQSIQDLKNHTVAFGGELSASGHIMPRKFLWAEFGLEPEAFFSEVTFSIAPDQTVYSVKDGTADLGVISTTLLQRMLRDGQLEPNEVRVLWRTPPYSNDFWMLPSAFNEMLTTRIRDAFLSLDPHTQQGHSILAQFNANFFIPAIRSDFRTLTGSELILGQTDEVDRQL